ncbi:MAG: hypothetical protein ACI9WC_001784 [Arenicella sp.]|jgi:hypothetical protein
MKVMKNILIISAFLFSSVLNAQSKEVLLDDEGSSCPGVSVSSESPNTSQPALITSDGKAYSKKCFSSFLNDLVVSLDAAPLVLFVHGRGKHPSKAFQKENRLLQNIEKEYGVKVVMFTWPSWCGVTCLPKKNAARASSDLLDVIRLLGTIKAETKTKQTFSLLTHSMGAFVLKGLISLPLKDISNDIFTSILISASATPAKGHEEWVEALKISHTTYVLRNKKDKTLKCIEGAKFPCFVAFNQPKLLGRWGKNTHDKSERKTTTEYVDFTGMVGKTHRYYINQQKKSPKVFEFYKAVFNGQSPQNYN